MPSQTTAELLANCLKRCGVTTIFGQSIPSPLMQVVARYGIRQVSYRTENAGGAMADGFARISGSVGLVAAQNGPAAALLVAPLAEALKASIPMLALVQDIARSDVGRNAFQEIDHKALFAGCAKWIGRVDRPDQLETQLYTAIRHATGGRPGPAVLMLPMDLLREECFVTPRREAVSVQLPLSRSIPSGTQLRIAADILFNASKPLIVAGGGAHLSGAYAALKMFQDEFGIPVATSNMGKGVTSDSHPLSIGVIGNCMGRSAPSSGMRDYVKSADVVVLVGTRTNQNGTDSWRLFGDDAQFIHIDVDPSETGRNYDSIPLIGDARDTLDAIADVLREMGSVHYGDISPVIHESRKVAAQDFEVRRAPRNVGVRPEAVMDVLNELLPPDAIVCSDASYSTNWVATYLSASLAGARFLMPRGLAGLGWGFPMALGAKVASPSATVVAVVGDGGFGHCWSELEAAKREGISVTVVVLNNGVLGYQKHAEDREFGSSTDACDFGAVDHALIAQACGCLGLTVLQHEEIRPQLERAIANDGPAVVDISTDPDAVPPLTLFECSESSKTVSPALRT